MPRPRPASSSQHFGDAGLAAQGAYVRPVGRGTAEQVDGSSLLFGRPQARFRLPGRFVNVSGLNLPSTTARPGSGLHAWVVIGSLAERCKDDSAWTMFTHLTQATMKVRVTLNTELKNHKAVSEDLRRDKVVAAFERSRTKDPGLLAWELDEIQWDICMHAVSEAYHAGGFEGADIDDIAATYRYLCGAEVEERGAEEILCVGCMQVVSYRSVSGEAWRAGFGDCGRICGNCV